MKGRVLWKAVWTPPEVHLGHLSNHVRDVPLAVLSRTVAGSPTTPLLWAPSPPLVTLHTFKQCGRQVSIFYSCFKQSCLSLTSWRTILEHSVKYQSDLRYITKLCQRHQEPARLCRLTPDHLLWKHLLPSCHLLSCKAKSHFEVMHCQQSSGSLLSLLRTEKSLRHFLEKMCSLVP